VLRLDAALSTMEREAAEQGLDWEEVLTQRAREAVRAKELGLAGPQVAALMTAQNNPQADQRPED
jgi:capsid protein